ncbi:hypothetical protein [Sporosarcina sp. E16_8]|uniref:hypothetical protein n=1 Tax=Sporosarcina sp. E16_8 TaxID=2789295 RepID=UPI001A92745E|nr:hypothetical protein [Sporosarcina sp. E16_8]MBO0589657.1 hypothetical protein [Sporosarcina sp. E16_8]
MFQKSCWNHISFAKKIFRGKTGVAITFVLMSLLLVGCTQDEPQDKNIALIQAYLEYDLNTPNKEAIQAQNEMWKSFEEQQQESSPFSKEYSAYIKDNYGPYFSESGFDKLISRGLTLVFHLAADKYDYQTTVSKIAIEQNKNVPTNYNFTVTIDYEKKGKEKVNAEITGIAILRPGGIEEIKYLGDKKMLRTLLTGE